MLLPKGVPVYAALLCLAGSLGCLYIPPLSHATGRKTVVALQPETETRQSLHAKLGEPDVVDLSSVQVWAWRQNLGTVIGGSPMGGGGFNLQGGQFRVLARYDGDRVVALETELQPPMHPVIVGPPLPSPTERLALEPAPAAEGPRHYRAWAGPDGALYACGWTGDLWVRAPGSPRATLVAQLGSLSGKGNLNVASCSFSASGHRLALAREAWVTVWDAETGQQAARLPALDPDPDPVKGRVDCTAALSPDGSRLAIAAARSTLWRGRIGGGLRVLDTATWRTVWALPEAAPGHLCFSPDGTRLLVNGALHDAATGRRIASQPPSHAHFLPGGRLHLLQGDELRLLDTASGDTRAQISLHSPARDASIAKLGWGGFDLRVLPDGSLLAVGNGVFIRCELKPCMPEAPGPAAALQPAVRLLPLRQVYEGRLMDPKWELEPMFVWQLSPDGAFILEQGFVHRQAGAQSYLAAKFLRILDAHTLQTLWEEWPPREECGETRFLEDGRLLRTVNGEIQLWRLPVQR